MRNSTKWKIKKALINTFDVITFTGDMVFKCFVAITILYVLAFIIKIEPGALKLIGWISVPYILRGFFYCLRGRLTMNKNKKKEIYKFIKVIDNANRLIMNALNDDAEPLPKLKGLEEEQEEVKKEETKEEKPKPDKKKIKRLFPKIKIKFKSDKPHIGLVCLNKECTHYLNERCTVKDLVVCEERVLK